jgi:hypothetical protein
MSSAVAADPTTTGQGLDLVLLAAGLLLCFLGVRSLKLAAACAGFGLAAELAAVGGAGPVPSFVVGAVGAAAGAVLVAVLVRVGVFVVGALAGGLIAVSVYRILPGSVAVPPGRVVVVVLLVALLCGAAMRYVRGPVVRAVTSLAGAALVVHAVVEGGPAFLGFLRNPATWVESVVALAALLALAWAGFVVQRPSRAVTRR